MIEIHELTKTYRGVTAVDSLTFSVRPGQVTGFLGPNGAGKTTTLRILLGLNRPSSGSATIDGRPYRADGLGLRRVGALLEANDVHKGRTAGAHLAALARSNGLPRQRVDEVLAEVGLTDVKRRRVGAFSLGMRQRLGIATALLGDPPVLIFDEPINGLDPEGIRWARDLFRRLAAEGRTVFVSSHVMSEMEHTADHLVVVGRGRLIADEPLSAFAARATRASVVVRTPKPSELREVLVAAGATVSAAGTDTLEVAGLSVDRVGELAFEHRLLTFEVSAKSGGLEEAFMELTADAVQYPAGSPR